MIINSKFPITRLNSVESLKYDDGRVQVKYHKNDNQTVDVITYDPNVGMKMARSSDNQQSFTDVWEFNKSIPQQIETLNSKLVKRVDAANDLTTLLNGMSLNSSSFVMFGETISALVTNNDYSYTSRAWILKNGATVADILINTGSGLTTHNIYLIRASFSNNAWSYESTKVPTRQEFNALNSKLGISLQAGTEEVGALTANTQKEVSVTFPHAFSSISYIIVTPLAWINADALRYVIKEKNVSGFKVRIICTSNVAYGDVKLMWFACGS